MSERIALAMSGGVDSSVAAWLLKSAGEDLLGITMQLFDPHKNSAQSAPIGDVQDARAVAARLGFSHEVVDFSQQFHENVIAPFVRSYEQGQTPNPCVQCNRTMKFGALLEAAHAHGCEKIATGHYVRVLYDAATNRYAIGKAAHAEKDQSYVLYSLSQQQLASSVFPLGGLSKAEVRAIAAQNNLLPAHKKESQDICFIPDGDYAAFIARETAHSCPQGNFVDEDGKILGEHRGIIHYTVGQRRGLGVSSNHGALYVKSICPKRNEVVLSTDDGLYTRTLTATHINWMPFVRLDAPLRCKAKVRYRMSEQPCVVEQTDEDTVRVTFDAPQRAITGGQSVVFYEGDMVVGGGVIQLQ